MLHTRVLSRLLASVSLLALAVWPMAVGAQKPSGGYAGSASCEDCHKDYFAPFAKTAMGQAIMAKPVNEHAKLGCESCHGPAKSHAESGGEDKSSLISYRKTSKTPVADRNATCLACHEKTARTLWAGSTHEARGLACTDCHVVMHANSEKANLRRQTVLATCGNCHKDKAAAMTKFSHMPLAEGKMECVNCHAPHGSPNEKLLVGTSVNETCFQCHQEKRGPFMWQHQPVTENCANCHDPHGSNKQRMLKTPLPRLCQQCHATPHGAPSGRPADLSASRFNYNKGCSNCHSQIHGSNHPAGAFFTR